MDAPTIALQGFYQLVPTPNPTAQNKVSYQIYAPTGFLLVGTLPPVVATQPVTTPEKGNDIKHAPVPVPPTDIAAPTIDQSATNSNIAEKALAIAEGATGIVSAASKLMDGTALPDFLGTDLTAVLPPIAKVPVVNIQPGGPITLPDPPVATDPEVGHAPPSVQIEKPDITTDLPAVPPVSDPTTASPTKDVDQPEENGSAIQPPLGNKIPNGLEPSLPRDTTNPGETAMSPAIPDLGSSRFTQTFIEKFVETQTSIQQLVQTQKTYNVKQHSMEASIEKLLKAIQAARCQCNAASNAA